MRRSLKGVKTPSSKDLRPDGEFAPMLAPASAAKPWSQGWRVAGWFAAIAISAIGCAQQTQQFRAYRKQGTMDDDFRGVPVYLIAWTWAPLWLPILVAAVLIEVCGKAQQPTDRGAHSLKRLWPRGATRTEMVGALLVAAPALAWLICKMMRDFAKVEGPSIFYMEGVALAFGVGAIPLITVLLFPSSASAGVLRLLGTSPERAVAYHRWIGTAAMAMVCLHGGLFISFWAYLAGIVTALRMAASPDECDVHTKICVPAGTYAVCAGLVLGALSLPIVRRRAWHVGFRVGHVLLAPVFLFGAAAHWRTFSIWIAPAAAAHAAALASRMLQRWGAPVVALSKIVDPAASQSFSPSSLPGGIGAVALAARATPNATLNESNGAQQMAPGEDRSFAPLQISGSRIEEEREMRAGTGMHVGTGGTGLTQGHGRLVLRVALPPMDAHGHPGQWVGIAAPNAMANSHPATLISAPAPHAGSASEVLLVLDRRGALARAAQTAQAAARGDVEGSGGWARHAVRVRGPYGGIPPLDPATPTLLAAGGSGITPILALLSHEGTREREGSSFRDNRGHLYAGTREADRHVCWAMRSDAALLTAAMPALAAHTRRASVRIHATASSGGHGGCLRSALATGAHTQGEAQAEPPATGAWIVAEPRPALTLVAACVGMAAGFFIPPDLGEVNRMRMRMRMRASISPFPPSSPSQSPTDEDGHDERERERGRFTDDDAILSRLQYLEATYGRWARGPTELAIAWAFSLSAALVAEVAARRWACHRTRDRMQRLHSPRPSTKGDMGGGGGGGGGVCDGIEVASGRPVWRDEIDQLLARAPRLGAGGVWGAVEVVVGGPEGMVAELRRECATHPKAHLIKFRACSFVM